jgi:hypothetical protein
MTMPRRAIAIVDGEHYPPVVRSALEEVDDLVVAAVLIGGTEKLRADVREAKGKCAAREAEPVGRPEHGLVREVDDDLDIVLARRRGQRVDERHAVLFAAAKLLRSADEVGSDELIRQLNERVPHRRGVVLAVDDRERAGHERVVTSPSIRAVYFSNARVSVEN